MTRRKHNVLQRGALTWWTSLGKPAIRSHLDGSRHLTCSWPLIADLVAPALCMRRSLASLGRQPKDRGQRIVPHLCFRDQMGQATARMQPTQKAALKWKGRVACGVCTFSSPKQQGLMAVELRSVHQPGTERLLLSSTWELSLYSLPRVRATGLCTT